MEYASFGPNRPGPRAGRFGRLNLWIITALVALLVAGLVLTASVGTFAAGGPGGLVAQVATPTLPQSGSTVTGGASIADIAAQANPAVVTITTTQQVAAGNGALDPNQNPFGGGGTNNPFGQMPSQVQQTSVGSGFIIDTTGHIVTNAHVVGTASQVDVTFADGSSHTAKVLGTDDFQDVAVLRLDLSDGTKVPATLAFGDSSSVRAGDQVIAIGTPLGEYPNTVSAGIIGATDRSLDTGAGYQLGNLLQHDAPIYPGNSGGPLLNMQGQVVGVNTAKATSGNGLAFGGGGDVNINFAIASNQVKQTVDQLIQSGSITRPYLGIQGQQLADGHGVVSVEAGSPAAKAGLQRGDIITAVDGQAIDANHPLTNLLFDHKPGDTITLTILRGGQTQSVSVTLGTRPGQNQ